MSDAEQGTDQSTAALEKKEDTVVAVTTPPGATFTVASMSLISTALSPAWGSLSDIFGLKIVLIFNIVEFLAFTAVCGAATSMTTLIVGRILQGIGGGAIIALSFVVIGEVIPPSELGKYTGILGAIAGSTAAVGPLIGGVIVDQLNWRWGFYIVLPFGGLALLGAIFGVKVAPPKGTIRDQILRVDYIGLVLLTGACTALMLALSWGGTTYAWASGEVIGCFVVAFAVLAAFSWWEAKHATEPIVPLQLFMSWNYVVAVVCLFFVGWAVYGLSYFIPLYFQTVRGMSATDSGVNNLPFTVFMIVFSMSAGIMVAKTGQYRFIPALGLALVAVGMGVFYLWDTDSSKVLDVLPQIAAGAGVGLVTNVGQMVAQTSTPRKLNGPASTFANFARLLGGVIGITAFQTVFSNVLRSKLADYFTAVAIQYQLTPQQLALYSAYISNRYSAQRADISSIPADAVAALSAAYLQATVNGLRLSFISGAAVVAVGAVLAIFIRQVPLKKTLDSDDEETVPVETKHVESEPGRNPSTLPPVSRPIMSTTRSVRNFEEKLTSSILAEVAEFVRSISGLKPRDTLLAFQAQLESASVMLFEHIVIHLYAADPTITWGLMYDDGDDAAVSSFVKNHSIWGWFSEVFEKRYSFTQSASGSTLRASTPRDVIKEAISSAMLMSSMGDGRFSGMEGRGALPLGKEEEDERERREKRATEEERP
ncbi:MFS general substrate transporter [Gonapodya prolifera JEL478]|uniref:MFS general substrate transporter n=1 Tax=Gonapodya prolifera (strain JEL478) TaxID=1344416 RepID=A0A139AYA2_GONPJ|nr:MFS general substrate transporter [Gonapodya prolifera JEL478]|eukprot:KXS21699.1 MFS general substrate transporter [Gonapodya prolifera JEL478]